jgi:hypothetical protein
MPDAYLRRALAWLVTSTVVYLMMNGAQVFETALIVPSWTAAPPASLQFYLRVGVFVAISLALLPLIGRVATLLYRRKDQ